MELRKGIRVISKAGHDKDCSYIVYNIEGTYAFLVNGTNRTLECPKKKKLKHLQPAGEPLLPEGVWTNEEIKRALKLAKRID